MAQPRLVPMVILAASALLALKLLALSQGNLQARAAEAINSLKQDPFAGVVVDPIVTGSGGGGHDAPPPADAHGGAAVAPGEKVKASNVRTNVTEEKPPEAKPIPGSELLSEIEILKRLSDRRKQLDKLEEQLMMRENLLKATEERVDKRVDELKQIETKSASGGKSIEEEQKKQLADLVKMYEAMKPKDAARVFDGLELRLLVDLARAMNPKKLADVVSKMNPDIAQRMTVELARPAQAPAAVAPVPVSTELPKIQGKS